MNNNNNQNQNNNLRYIGKVKSTQHQNGQTGETFVKENVLIDNPNNLNADGTPNQYYKGSLLWYDAATGQYFQVKQIEFAGASQNDQQRGFTKSLRVDLGNQYHVQKMNG